MRPTLCWSDLAGSRVGLFGLGREGEANLRACRARGIEPVLVDDAPHERGEGEPRVLATAAGGLDALLSCDVVIKTPGISRYGSAVTALQDAGVAVVGGLGLWLQEADRRRVVCITGTKGKSTTTAIVGHLLEGLGYRCFLGGNFGLSPFDPVVGTDYDFWVIEVSSYQATDVSTSPPVVAVTSLHPDHLPWHGFDLQTYYGDKLSLCSQPGADLTVANGDSDLIRARRSLLGPRVQWIRADDDPEASWMEPLHLLGTHNRRNALIARALLHGLGVPQASNDDELRRACAGFTGLDSRLQVIGELGGVEFVDDGLSTNVLSALAAIDAYSGRRVALIVGGMDRGIDYRQLASGLASRTTELLLLAIPDNGPKILEAVTAVGTGPAVTTVLTASLEEAVRRGYEWAVPDGVVLLSPAAASFGRFHDYRERGVAFAAAMGGCVDVEAPK